METKEHMETKEQLENTEERFEECFQKIENRLVTQNSQRGGGQRN